MTQTMDAVWAGVDRLLDGFAKVGPQDTAVVGYTPESRESAAWIITALRERGIPTRTLTMRPLIDPDIERKLTDTLPGPDGLGTGRLVVITAERDTMSHTGVFRDVLGAYDPSRRFVARIINASTEFFTHALNIGPEELSARNAALLDRFMTARLLRVTTAGGTDLRIDLDPERFAWLSNRGVWRPGPFMVMPPGEVATFPDGVEGVLVADGAFNVNVLTRIDARLARNPVTVRVKDGHAVEWECADPSVQKLIDTSFAAPNATRVGEVGFGTNHGIPDWVELNSHINERRPGLHIGFGQHNQNLSVIDYDCDIHLDLIADGALVWVDDDPEPIDLRTIQPSSRPHPLAVIDEDIDGDCCGLWLSDLQAGQCVPRAALPDEH